MRWNPYEQPVVGSEKLVERFLFLPVKLPLPGYTGEEWRWLERAWLYKRYMRRPAGPRYKLGRYGWYWHRWK